MIGFGDYSNGGYAAGFNGDLSELEDDCYEWSSGAWVCFRLTTHQQGCDTEEHAEPEAEPASFTIGGHTDWYNGLYVRAEDWNGFPHFAKEDRSAHFYYSVCGTEGDSCTDYWYLDHNEQDGTRAWYNGGWIEANSPYEWEDAFADGWEVLESLYGVWKRSRTLLLTTNA